MKQKTLLILAVCLAAVFIALVVISGNLPEENIPDGSESISSSEPTIPSSTPTEPSTEPTEPTNSTEVVTAPTETVPPTEATEPETRPTQPGVEYIGSLYTRQELEAMENVRKGYSFGVTSGGKPAPNAVKTQNTYGQYAGNFIGPDNGCIYLTFDCGYEYNNLTADILDTLMEKDVKAVFFITMSYAKKNPELVQRMIDEGHIVGNHSNRHKEMPTLTIDQMVDEVMSLHNYILEHFNYEMTLFRPPTGSFSTRSLAVVQSLGYKNVHWSFAYQDWETGNQPKPDASLEKILSSHHSGAIYLLHAVSQTNATILADAIDGLRDMGYKLELFR